MQNIREYEKMQKSLVLLKILAQGRKSLDEGKVRPAKEAFKKIRKKLKEIQGK